ncbi:MAG: proline--tRNA ligase [Spirochaetales bacterium]|nr:proline--tRNA ligase [Spirochaetales bacterium]
MRVSRLFSHTLKELPSEAQVESHRLLIRGGFIQQLAAGLFGYLPLARRVMNKIEAILHEEMQKIGGQEVTMPVILPSDIWKDSGRWYQIGAEMSRFTDRKDHEMCLAMTHEEALTDLARKIVKSYKQLPLLVYHVQTKWRDDPRPRAGLIRVREFTMKDSYSLDTDWEGLDKQYRAHYQAYFNIFHRCGIPVQAVTSDTGMMGGKLAHEFMYLTEIGEDTIITCPSCGYTANRQVAVSRKEPLPGEEPKALEKVHTPGCKTIEDLAAFLSIPREKTAKAVFFMAEIAGTSEETEEKLVMAIVRGDMELNETKLANAVKAKEIRPAREEEIEAVGAVPGFASPRGIKDALVVVDDLIPESSNLVAGANETDYHLVNVNYGRDYQAALVTDLVAAGEGDRCTRCGASLKAAKAVEVGNIFKLGTRYSESMGCVFQDKDGDTKPVIMGSYGIGVGRLMAAVAEEHHDKDGLIWPVSIAPYQVYLIRINDTQDDLPCEKADGLYEELLEQSLEVLYDDRDERPGVKFKDADLIGLPIRLTVSKRSLEAGGVEFSVRGTGEKRVVPLEKVLEEVKETLFTLFQELQAKVVPQEYRD